MAHPLSADSGNGFSVPDHDYQLHSGTTNAHGPTQIVYRKGGAAGKIVATETITYDANNYIATRRVVWAKDIFM
jgi:hypothetical protein